MADHDELIRRFDHVKVAAAHFGQKPLFPDLTVDPRDGSSDDRAALHGACGKNLIQPATGLNGVRRGLHRLI